MSLFILGAVIGLLCNFIAALFSREKALKLIPWILLYIGFHGIYVLVTADFFEAQAMKWTQRIHPHWLSYVVLMSLAAVMAALWWKAVNVAATKMAVISHHESGSAPPSASDLLGVSTPHTTIPTAIRRPPPITKVNKFATIVPFDPTNKNVPIPMNANYEDEKARYYSDLLGLGARPEKQKDGTAWPDERNFDTEESRGQFIGRLLQCYVARSIDELERDSEGMQWTAGQGSKPIIRVGIAPPDRAPYSAKSFIAEVAKSGFLRPMDQMVWENRSVDFPRHTKISLIEHPTSPATGVAQYIVRLERPGYFSIDFKVTQTLGPIRVTGVSGASMPKGFHPASGTMDAMLGYPFIVTMAYEIQRTNDDDFRPEDYVTWVDALFAGLKQRMSSD
jgi:hypothetical protein